MGEGAEAAGGFQGGRRLSGEESVDLNFSKTASKPMHWKRSTEYSAQRKVDCCHVYDGCLHYRLWFCCWFMPLECTPRLRKLLAGESSHCI